MNLGIIKIAVIALLFSFQYGLVSSTFSQNISGEDLKDNINDLSVMDMDNNQVQLSDYNGKVLLIINVASECGYTPQYKGLEEIYRKYNLQGFEILAFPCNDFGAQEPGTNKEIKEFCSLNYDVTFKLFDKIKVLGDDKSPLYERLTNNSVSDRSDINWNFEKFIVSKNGKIRTRFSTKVDPTDESITDIIEEELDKE